MRKFFKNKKFLFLLVFLGVFTTLSKALASDLNLDWPLSPGTQIDLTIDTPLPLLVQYFYEWGIALGGLATFIALLIAGFGYLTSVGDPAKMKEAIDGIKSALLGLVLLLGSYLILNIINPELTTLRLPTVVWKERGPLGCDTEADCNRCNTDADCGEDRWGETIRCKGGTCEGNPNLCTDLNPNNEIPEGVCQRRKEEPIICTEAVLFEKPHHGGGTYTLPLGETEAFSTFSVKAYTKRNGVKIDCCDDIARKRGYYGCGCYLKVYASMKRLWWGCKDLETIVSACEKDISRYLDEEPKCVKLISP